MDQNTNTEIPQPDRGARTLPFARWWAVFAGAIAGVMLRVAFGGRPGDPYAPMMAAFIYFSPLFVGAVTVYIAEMQRRRTWGYYIKASFLASVLYVAGTLILMIEGWVCAVVIIPLFATLGIVGGLLMGIVCRSTNWPRQALMSFGALPLVLGGFETGISIPDHIRTVEREVTIEAPAEKVWANIINAPDIKPSEVSRGWLFRMGVPVPLAGRTRETTEGRVRRVTMGTGIYFDEVISEWRENRYVHWRYRFSADSFPPHSLDEHVEIGGRYFDLRNTSYTLTPRGERTELKVRMEYRVSTPFNWYADPVARVLLGNLEETNLAYYRGRSEVARSAQR